ncbi:MAG: hypothetical protein ABIW82_17125 [Dokdonella sp.]
MDVLDLLIADEATLAIEVVQGPVSRVHYYDGALDREAILQTLDATQSEATYEEAVFLSFLKYSPQGSQSWVRIDGPGF